MQKVRSLAWILATLGLASMTAHPASRSAFTLSQMLHYPYAAQLASAEQADVIAWVRNVDGVRNIWMARGPGFAPLQLTQYTADDGQELTQLTFSPDGARRRIRKAGVCRPFRGSHSSAVQVRSGVSDIDFCNHRHMVRRFLPATQLGYDLLRLE